MSSDPVGTRCSRCASSYEPTPAEPHRCACGAPLELVETRPPPPVTDGPITGVRAVADALPAGPLVDLGAGGTPSVAVEAFGATLKLETCNPTGSFKDRGAAVVLSRALALGADRIKEDSSGNAGLAIAAHAGRAGVDATVYVPGHAAGSTLEAIRATGATLVPVEGTRAAVAAACEAADAGWYASHAWRPEFYEGTATLAWELVAEGGSPPDAVVLPVGHGTLLLGLYRGFERLLDAGSIGSIPALYAAQLDGDGSLVGHDAPVDPTIAPGIRITEPARAGQVRRAIEASGGRVVPVAPEAVGPARTDLARHGFDVGSTAAVGLAARRALDEQAVLDPTDEVVVVLTGRARDR